MSSLLSQSSNPVPPTPILPMLTGAADYPIYMTKLRNHLKSNFGKTGQNILKSTTITLSNPGDRPHYNDPRLHPDTNEPIPGTRMYEQEAPTAEQAADPNFDSKTLANSKINQKKKLIASVILNDVQLNLDFIYSMLSIIQSRKEYMRSYNAQVGTKAYKQLEEHSALVLSST